MTSVFTIDAAGCRLRIRCWTGHGKFAISLQFPFNSSDQFAMLDWADPFLYVEQIILEASHGVTFVPELEQRFGNILSGIVDSMSLHSHHLRFDERGTFATPGAFASLVGGVVDLAGVGAVDDHARECRK